jgi:hypothetical protein
MTQINRMKKITFLWMIFLPLVVFSQNNLFDTNLAHDAVAVVRVKLMVAESENLWPNGAFRTYVVHTIRIFKNESNERFWDIKVIAFKGRPGVPEQECTIYLQRYDYANRQLSSDKNHGAWILVGGDATNGVSNVAGGNHGERQMDCPAAADGQLDTTQPSAILASPQIEIK